MVSLVQAPPASIPLIVGRVTAQQTLTGTVTETILGTASIPASAMGPTGILRVQFLGSQNNNANNKIWRVRFSGISGTIIFTTTQTTNIGTSDLRYVGNREATNAQVFWGGGASFTNGGASSMGTATVDTTVATTLVLTGQLANTADNMKLELMLCELFPS